MFPYGNFLKDTIWAVEEGFEAWLEGQLVDRNWRPADLARAAKVPNATIARILNGDRKVGPDVAVAIARALGLSPEYVFRMAGLLPIEPDPIEREDRAIQELLAILRNLSPEDRRDVTDYALFRFRRSSNGGK